TAHQVRPYHQHRDRAVDGGRDFADAHVPAVVFGRGGLVHQPAQVVHRRAGIHAAGDQLGGEDGDAVVKLAAGEDVFRQRTPIAITAAVTVVGLGATVGSAFRAPRRAFVAELMQDLD